MDYAEQINATYLPTGAYELTVAGIWSSSSSWEYVLGFAGAGHRLQDPPLWGAMEPCWRSQKPTWLSSIFPLVRFLS